MSVLSVSLPDDLLARADAHAARRGYAGRSELLRVALRAFLDEDAAEREGPWDAATVTLRYDERASRRIGRIRHDHADVVRSMMHAHSGGACVEVLFVEGPRERVAGFIDALHRSLDAKLVRAVYVGDGQAPSSLSAARLARTPDPATSSPSKQSTSRSE